jgi:hypothetical protein
VLLIDGKCCRKFSYSSSPGFCELVLQTGTKLVISASEQTREGRRHGSKRLNMLRERIREVRSPVSKHLQYFQGPGRPAVLFGQESNLALLIWACGSWIRESSMEKHRCKNAASNF